MASWSIAPMGKLVVSQLAEKFCYLYIAMLLCILPTRPEHNLSSVSIYFWTNHLNVCLLLSALTSGPTT
jgi:hypothetical protein